MDGKTSLTVYDGMVVPESVLIRPIRKDKYGSVPGLDDEALADPDELERQVLREEWAPVLVLPVPNSKKFNPAWDWSVDVDFNAFASVDFERTQPEFDKVRYKADKLREDLKNLIIMIDTVRARIPGKAKYRVLKYVKNGSIELENISDFDMYCLAEMYLRALRMYAEIRRLEDASRARKAKRLKAWLEA